MNQIRRILLSEKPRNRVARGTTVAALTFVAIRFSTWLRIRDVHPGHIDGVEVALTYHIGAAVAAGLVAATATQKNLRRGLVAFTLTCFCLCVCVLLMMPLHGFGVDGGEALLSLPLAVMIGLAALLWKGQLGPGQRVLAIVGLLLVAAYWALVWDSGLLKWTLIGRWLGMWPADRPQVYDAHDSPVALLFLPALVLLMMLAESNTKPALGDTSNTIEEGAP